MTSERSSHKKLAFYDQIGDRTRPRIALMGEFSAGKSTLANLMIGSDPLPMQVIATQLPPVWISYGTGTAAIIDLEGNDSECDLEKPQKISSENTAFIRIQRQEQILQMCDIIDMPGISDPNMPADVWARILPFADAVIWCTPATQAWRQSEAAVWETVPAHIQEKSILLLTRADMLISEKDRSKVLKRVTAETENVFAKCCLMSLTLARDAADDPDQWECSGAEAFVTDFLDIVADLTHGIAKGETTEPFELECISKPEETGPTGDLEVCKQDADNGRVVPRRPVAKTVRARTDDFTEAVETLSLSPKFS
ncbi:dynamin family protein [Roseobacter sp.]|uniref:dynamin family protein n=1 Tax=Roseobacter sp. TaxID=1907202 RepID=UPI00385C6EC7